MTNPLSVLLITAISLGAFHAFIGPDHYLPFIMLSKARKWTYGKTLVITIACGIGHVLSSIAIGLVGIGVGLSISKVQGIEGFRGDIAAYLLFAFGLAYMSWGIKQGIKGRHHEHSHVHADGIAHDHGHVHMGEHSHVHARLNSSFWWLFVIFVLGPCEPLIPILMYPAARMGVGSVAIIALVFSLATILTMVFMVSLAFFGLHLFRFSFLERYAHAIGGAIIALSGAGMVFLGW